MSRGMKKIVGLIWAAIETAIGISDVGSRQDNGGTVWLSMLVYCCRPSSTQSKIDLPSKPASDSPQRFCSFQFKRHSDCKEAHIRLYLRRVPQSQDNFEPKLQWMLAKVNLLSIKVVRHAILMLSCVEACSIADVVSVFNLIKRCHQALSTCKPLIVIQTKILSWISLMIAVKTREKF